MSRVKQSSLLGSHPILILYIHPNPIYIYKIHDTERCFFVSRDQAAKVISEVTTEAVRVPTHRTRPLRRSGHLRDSILSICVFARRTFLLEGEACSSCGMSVHSVAGDSNRMWRVHAQDTVDALTGSTTRRVHTGETEFPAPTPESLLPRRTAPWVRRCQRLVHAHQADHCDFVQQS